LSFKFLFSRQTLAGAGIELLVVNGLYAEDGGDAENVARVGTAGNIGGGTIQTKDDLAVGGRPRELTRQFAGDVA